MKGCQGRQATADMLHQTCPLLGARGMQRLLRHLRSSPNALTQLHDPVLQALPRHAAAANGTGLAHSRLRSRMVQVSQAVAGLDRPVSSSPSSSFQPPAPGTSFSKPSELEAPPVGYELVQGALARWSEVQKGQRAPPTVVMIHGILGSRKNMQAFAHRLVEGLPSWQVLLVDLRCHGESAQLEQQPAPPHSVESSAKDTLTLLSRLKIFPEALVGHSFGGKVVLSMADQFGRMGKQLPRPVQVWVLDALPGEVRSGERGGQDHPADLIAALQQLPMPIPNRSHLQNYLVQRGFSLQVARWASTNLRPLHGDHRGLTSLVLPAKSDQAAKQHCTQQQAHLRPVTAQDVGVKLNQEGIMDTHRPLTRNGTFLFSQPKLVWNFNLEGIKDMYESYEASNLWPFITDTAQGLRVHFVKAEHSTFRWAGPEETVITSYGHAVHLLHKAGHWVHADNPDGLFEIMSPSLGSADLHMRRASHLPARSRS